MFALKNNLSQNLFLSSLVYVVDQLVKSSVITFACGFWIRYQLFFSGMNFYGNTLIRKIRDFHYSTLFTSQFAENYPGLGINFLWSSEVYQGLERLRYHFCDESNSKQRSIETVHMCSTSGFQLTFMWCLWVSKSYRTVFFPLFYLNNVIILKTYY